MINLAISRLVEILGAQNATERNDVAVDVSFNGVTIDSRGSCDQQLFVAIKGDHFDGHDFVDTAYQNGAIVALVEQPVDSKITQIKVSDCKRAMATLARYWRRHCHPIVISLTGSNGKTTVKEMLYQILEKQSSAHATSGNFNNDIGVPLTLFGLCESDDFAIIEMGANHRGEIELLAGIAEPDIVYVNNVAASHLTGFGSVQGVIEAKSELYAYCKPEHKALFNIDEVASDFWQGVCAAETRLTCGINKAADVTATWQAGESGMEINFSYQGQSNSCELAVMGEHNARNALAAVSLAILAGLELPQVVSNLAGFSGVKGRLQMMRGPASSRLINDSYNANPDSLEAGIKVVCALPGSAWLALGDMGELGSESESLHRIAAQTAAKYGIKRFFGVGEMSCIASEEFGDGGYCFDSINDMGASILAHINADVNLLVKGSRSAGMERLVTLLTAADIGAIADKRGENSNAV
ncbi:MAG: UDP-N-acetylmuramoyl-tripeptide--D-alanyl-D-alanine ligase [Planctomycetota bacterium]|jgi:UDP-N-acetylmuramoyl-tripeptide--D-alanyl-D-alanine ligase